MEDFIKKITREAGTITLKYFGKIGVKYTKKDITDVVTEADLKSNHHLVNRIKKQFPDHGIISEELGRHQTAAKYVWIIDPLDGTRNFATHTPLFGVVVALAYQNRIILAAIYDPVHDELFFAKKGKGAFCNKQKIHCSPQKKWQHSFGCIGAAWRPKRLGVTKNLLALAEQEAFWVSSFGSTSITSTYLADGRRDWYISFDSCMWDYAAASLILSEAGCIATNKDGRPWQLGDDTLVAANKYLHPKLLQLAQASWHK